MDVRAPRFAEITGAAVVTFRVPVGTTGIVTAQVAPCTSPHVTSSEETWMSPLTGHGKQWAVLPGSIPYLVGLRVTRFSTPTSGMSQWSGWIRMPSRSWAAGDALGVVETIEHAMKSFPLSETIRGILTP
jgi:hypothetical protein